MRAFISGSRGGRLARLLATLSADLLAGLLAGLLGLHGQAHAAQGVQVIQKGPGFTSSSTEGGDAHAFATVLPGIGHAKLLAGATTSGRSSASATASRSLDGTGVLIGRIGGLGEPQIVRGSIRFDFQLGVDLAPSLLQADNPANCCSVDATLDLNLSLERADPDLGFVGQRDFEVDIIDRHHAELSAIGVVQASRETQFSATGDGFLAPGAERAYQRGERVYFSFLLPEGGDFRLTLEAALHVQAQAHQPLGYECVTLLFPQGICVANPASASIVFDATQSLYWGGLELVDATGSVLPFDYVALDGLNLAESHIPEVPEASTAWLLCMGLLAVRGLHRPRERRHVST